MEDLRKVKTTDEEWEEIIGKIKHELSLFLSTYTRNMKFINPDNMDGKSMMNFLKLVLPERHPELSAKEITKENISKSMERMVIMRGNNRSEDLQYTIIILLRPGNIIYYPTEERNEDGSRLAYYKDSMDAVIYGHSVKGTYIKHPFNEKHTMEGYILNYERHELPYGSTLELNHMSDFDKYLYDSGEHCLATQDFFTEIIYKVLRVQTGLMNGLE